MATEGVPIAFEADHEIKTAELIRKDSLMGGRALDRRVPCGVCLWECMPESSYTFNLLARRILSANEMDSVADLFNENAKRTIQINTSSKAQEVPDRASACNDVDRDRAGIHLHNRDNSRLKWMFGVSCCVDIAIILASVTR
ncbi:hypothetical protein LB506_004734 [Fusarium annulatum]|nr:hypothetical protein LB506_004734 [Fusarium annulatum]